MVEISLNEQRTLAVDLYYEDQDTPDEQLIRNNDIRTLLGLLSNEEVEYYAMKVTKEINVKFFSYLYKVVHVSSEKLKIFIDASESYFFPSWQHISLVLAEIIPFEESDLKHVCLGIFNGIYVDQINKRITQLRELVESSEEKQQLKLINQLMYKSYWKAVGLNLHEMFEKFHEEGR